MDFLKGLNPQQREAVACTEGPLLILAGAGSGKTRVITHRIAYIITERHVPPSAILAVTFTNKAAQEMRARVAALLSRVELDSAPNLSTFHSFCVRLLRRDGEPLAQLRPGFTRRFSIYDDEDQLALIKAAFRHLGLDEKFMQYRAALSRISHAKNLKETPQDFYRKANDPTASKLAVIWDEYEKALLTANALDFDDLLLETVRLLHHDEATRGLYNRRLSYIMIDEYQDTNRSQYELMRLLSQTHGNVCVVGDEDQSIYSWRGADIQNILDFEHDFPRARVIRLEQNYRSTKTILAAAGAVVAKNKARKGKTLWTEADRGEMLGVYGGWDAENEGMFIAKTIERLLAESPKARVAVLYRTNSQSRQIEEALRRHGRQYLVVGGFSFYQRAEIKDAVAYLKLAMSNQDSVSLLRVINTPARGIGRTTIEQVDAFAREHGLSVWDAVSRMIDQQLFPARAQSALVAFRTMVQELSLRVISEPLPDAIRFMLDRTGYGKMLEQEGTPESEGRLENLGELVNAAAEAAERGETLGDFLDHAALVADADAVDEQAQVSLLTLHNAKGLEFPIVFLAGMEEGLFPHQRSMDSVAALEEERRLCYVGMTRAEKRLYLTWAKYRRRFGGGEQERTVPSRFLSEAPEDLMVNLGDDDRIPQVDLHSERYQVRQSAERNTFTGKTFNSLENISQFFAERGVPFPVQKPPNAGTPAGIPQARPPAAPVKAAPPAAPRRSARTGMTVEHPKYGTGTVVRREGEGEDAKITVSFPRYGLKKLVEKYAGLKRG
ncbi:MAG TPA: UvrD-helicase domain-containing protein [Bryobacteraceae bacterium]|jgi:DNA helicase-2/ATP-dependent DNA helicase PcrA|nr:UvrD-helicase domain-containing protein [Bryobacteraceae bacterium]